MGIMNQPHEADHDESLEDPATEVNEDPKMEEEEGEPGTDNEAYKAGMELVMQALYKNKAAKDIAKALGQGDPAKAIADIAYQVCQVADERTQGQIPDELLASFATDVMTEVAEIAAAAGVQVDQEVVSSAMSMMILRFLKEQGMPDDKIKQAMQAMGRPDDKMPASTEPPPEPAAAAGPPPGQPPMPPGGQPPMQQPAQRPPLSPPGM